MDDHRQAPLARPASRASSASAPKEERPEEHPLERLLSLVDVTCPEQALPAGLTLGSLVRFEPGGVAVRIHGVEFLAGVAAHVDVEFLRAAFDDGQPILVETTPQGRSEVVGVIQARFAGRLTLTAETIEIHGKRELTLRSGKAALRLREDGSMDLIGTRISAASRGLLRLVGRALRLN